MSAYLIKRTPFKIKEAEKKRILKRVDEYIKNCYLDYYAMKMVFPLWGLYWKHYWTTQMIEKGLLKRKGIGP